MASIQQQVYDLIVYAQKNLGLDKKDSLYYYNRVLSMIGAQGTTARLKKTRISDTCPDNVMKPLLEYAAKNGCDNGDSEKFAGDILSLISLRPSEINKRFHQTGKRSGYEKAMEDLHTYGIANDYVKASAIARNIKWESKDGLVITINLSKPEKDNKQIAKLLTLAKTGYPACQLCAENIGYCSGNTIRQTLRWVDITLDGQKWFWQFSPYAYFYQHGIAVNYEHTPMKLTDRTVARLFDFVEQFPFYFLGSNAALPRVGGSILNHDHYQGGKEVLPMQKVSVKTSLGTVDGVEVGILNWYNSALRMQSTDRKAIEKLAWKLSLAWENYDNAELDIISHTDGERHNIYAPIARKQGDKYVLDIILRNNRMSEQYPDGIFHAHKEYHNIKSEGIGLIEAMGLFVLPARLDRQLKVVEGFLCGEEYNRDLLADDMKIHGDMIDKLLAQYGNANSIDDAKKFVRQYVDDVCKNILYNTAVFKQDEQGQQAFVDFLNKALK